MDDLQKRSWAEISLENIRHNYNAIRASLPEGCRFLGVVKADAYGHGAVQVSHLLHLNKRPISYSTLPYCPALTKRLSCAAAG